MPRPPSDHRTLALLVRAAVAVGLLVVAGAIFFVLFQTRPQVEQIDPTAARPTVIVLPAQRVEVQRQWVGYGTAEALDSADVPARVTATVARIADGVQPGQQVTAGQPLVYLDEEDFVRQVEIAQQRIAELDAALEQLQVEQRRLSESLSLEDTDVALAQTEYDRQVNLRQRNVTNIQDVDTAQRTLINAKRSRLQTQQAMDLIGPRRNSLQAQRASQMAQVNLAELNRQRTTILSPIDGVIQALNVEVGENLVAGQQEPLARVVAVDHIEVPLALPAAARDQVQIGDRVVLTPTGPLADRLPFPGWTSRVVRIAPEADSATRTFTVFAELQQSGDEVRLPAPGMFLKGTVYVDTREPRFLVPRAALRGGRIQIADDGVLVSRPTEPLFNLAGDYPQLGMNNDQWSVLDDDALTEGQFVIANRATQLPDGTAVQMRLPDGTPIEAQDASPVAPGSDDPTHGEQLLPGAGAGP
jgi:multidrug efflux pump subunit AcrA (membrane-fusion protein)